MKRNKKWLKHRQGSILITVIIVFLFISAIVGLILTYNDNNLKQAKMQEYRMEAYYLAQSGCDIAALALLNKPSGGDTLFKRYTKDGQALPNGGKFRLTQSEISELEPEDIIDVEVSTVSDPTSDFDGWVRIFSKGKTKHSEAEKSLYLKPDAHGNKINHQWMDGR